MNSGQEGRIFSSVGRKQGKLFGWDENGILKTPTKISLLLELGNSADFRVGNSGNQRFFSVSRARSPENYFPKSLPTLSTFPAEGCEPTWRYPDTAEDFFPNTTWTWKAVLAVVPVACAVARQFEITVVSPFAR